MERVSFIHNMISAVKHKILVITGKRRQATTSLSLQSPINMDSAKIPISKPCKHIDVYYNGKAISLYQKIIVLFNKYSVDQKKYVLAFLELLKLYVTGWSELKELTNENMNYCEETLHYYALKINSYQSQLDSLYRQFVEENGDIDMMDHVKLPMYATVTEVPYRRVFQAILKKNVLNIEASHEFIASDINTLDEMIELLSTLNKGWEKCGEGTEFDKYRGAQRRLITLAHSYVDLIETDIKINECFIEVSQMTINFKIYPVIIKK